MLIQGELTPMFSSNFDFDELYAILWALIEFNFTCIALASPKTPSINIFSLQPGGAETPLVMEQKELVHVFYYLIMLLIEKYC